jgi:hypothetical protein
MGTIRTRTGRGSNLLSLTRPGVLFPVSDREKGRSARANPGRESEVGESRSRYRRVHVTAEFLGDIMIYWGPATELISIACAETGELEPARDVYMAVAAQSSTVEDKSKRALANAALAILYFRLYRDDQTAIEMWEGIMKEYPGTLAAVDASFALAPLYFTKATDPGTASTNPLLVSK